VIFTVLISHERPDLLWRTVKSYTQTKDSGCELLIVDNGSAPETLQLLGQIFSMGMADVIDLETNRYPGFATNLGWSKAPPGSQLLHRSDNDIEYLPGWPEQVRRMFRAHPDWGQLSMRTDEEELFQDAVGGNNVIRRAVWEAGVRYSEEPWSTVPWEDGDFNMRIRNAGFGWGRVAEPCIVHIGDKMRPDVDLSDPYYDRTYAERGITHLLTQARAAKLTGEET
jgi:GT2 family glycosyltransferase